MRARGREKEGGSRWEWRRERAVLSDAALFAKSTSSTLTPRQSSGEQVFSCTNPSSLQPASIFTMAAVAWSPLTPTIPRPPLRRSLSLYPLLCLHNATLAEDGREDTQLQNPSRPHQRQLLMGLPQQTKREKQTQAATLLCPHTHTSDEMI